MVRTDEGVMYVYGKVAALDAQEELTRLVALPIVEDPNAEEEEEEEDDRPLWQRRGGVSVPPWSGATPSGTSTASPQM